MKKSILVITMTLPLALTFALIAFTISCKKSVKTEKMTDEEIILLTKDLGSIHNKSLNNIAIRTNGISKNYAKRNTGINSRTSEYNEYMEEVGIAFLEETTSTIQTEYSDQYYFDSLQGINFIKESVLQITDYSAIYTINSQIQNSYIELSAQLMSLVNQINSILDYALTKEQLNIELDNLLYNEIGNLALEEEKLAFAAGISVAKSSFEYWTNQETINYWNTFSYGGRKNLMLPNSIGFRLNGNAIAKADFNGAVSGAIAGARYGFVATAAGGGVGGAMAGGVLGGALGAIGHSAVSGLKQAFGVETPWWLGWTGL